MPREETEFIFSEGKSTWTSFPSFGLRRRLPARILEGHTMQTQGAEPAKLMKRSSGKSKDKKELNRSGTGRLRQEIRVLIGDHSRFSLRGVSAQRFYPQGVGRNTHSPANVVCERDCFELSDQTRKSLEGNFVLSDESNEFRPLRKNILFHRGDTCTKRARSWGSATKKAKWRRDRGCPPQLPFAVETVCAIKPS
jgi:hypothetical protein